MKTRILSRIFPALIALLSLLAFAPLALAAEAAGQMFVHVLDVGQGDAILIRSPAGKNVLLDAGTPESTASLLKRLNELVKGPLDLVIMSHPHADHIGGMTEVLRKKGAKMFLDPGFDYASKMYADMVSALEELAIPVRLGQAGRKIDIGGGASLEIISPALPFFKNTRSDANANSIVALLTYGKTSFYLAADSEAETEQGILKRIVKEQGRSIKSTVYKVAHHGSRHASSEEILAEIQPEISVFSCGANNRYGHPTPEALSRVMKVGSKVYRTDENGEVTLVSDGKKVTAQPERGGESKTKPVFESDDPDANKGYVASSKGKTFHAGSCRNGRKVASGNRVKYATLEEAMASGKKPAKCCLKDNGQPKEEGGMKAPAGGSAASPSASSGISLDPDAEPQLPSEGAAISGGYVASKNSKKFHKASCKNGMKIKESNRVLFKTRDEAVASGRTPAGDCKP